MKTRRPRDFIKIGDRFGLLTVLDIVTKYEDDKYRKYLKCQCDCGNLTERRNDYVVSHNGRNFSCGCNHSMKINKGNKSVQWKGYKEISSSSFAQLQRHAKNRNIKVNITMEDMWNQYIKQNKTCALTGLPLIIKQSQRTHSIDEANASLDRIDSSKDYTPDNIQWIHKDINFMKNNFSENEFLQYCKLIYEFKNLQKLPKT